MISDSAMQNRTMRLDPLELPEVFSTHVSRINRSRTYLQRFLLMGLGLVFCFGSWFSMAPVDETIRASGRFVGNFASSQESYQCGELPRMLDARVSGKVIQSVAVGDVIRKGETVFEIDKTFRRRDLKLLDKLISTQANLLLELPQDQQTPTKVTILEYRRQKQQLAYEINQSEIKAPYDLVVTKVFFANGNYVHPGETVVSIAPANRNRRFQVRIHPKDIAKIEIGNQADIYPITFDLVKDDELKGEVILIDPAADSIQSDSGNTLYYYATIMLNENQWVDRRLTKLGTHGSSVVHTGKKTTRLNQFLNRLYRMDKR